MKNARQQIEQLDELIAGLPGFCKQFFTAMELNSTVLSCIAYGYDLKMFFKYINRELAVNDITLEYLDTLKAQDIENFLHWTTAYEDNGLERTNDSSAKSRKLSTLRAFYKYYFTHGELTNNPALLVQTPKIRKKEIIRLEPDEAVRLVDKIENQEGLGKRQRKFAEKTKYRDLAIVILMLGTGIRVSECVGIDMADINFENNEIKILRKGNKEQIIYFSNEVEIALKDYIELERKSLLSENSDEPALFISMKKRRISARAVENLVKKYSSGVTAKNITPHKLRSTFGTQLYDETGDIYLVADVLGHSSVATTTKHYAAMNKERVRNASRLHTIRENMNNEDF